MELILIVITVLALILFIVFRNRVIHIPSLHPALQKPPILKRSGTLVGTVTFTESSKYIVATGQTSWLKLTGISEQRDATKGSVMLAYRYLPEVDTFELACYVHTDKVVLNPEYFTPVGQFGGEVSNLILSASAGEEVEFFVSPTDFWFKNTETDTHGGYEWARPLISDRFYRVLTWFGGVPKPPRKLSINLKTWFN